MSEIRVNLPEVSYVIKVGSGLLESLGAAVASCGSPTGVLVVSNPTVARHYGARVLASLKSSEIRAETATVPAGERYKTLNTVRKIYDSMLDAGIDRGGAVVALGGGVIGDMAGFAAATYMRGIPVYQVPTTLLAQVDASVGGKTGVDLPQGKNLVGAFHQPGAVIIDITTLRTLPARELRCGLAEVVKHGIIRDQEFFHFLGSHSSDLLARHADALDYAVVRSVEIKRDVVQQDERESGLRAILNYGHTIGHAIEVLTGYSSYKHGEAVAIGMVTEALLAECEGIAQKGTARAVYDMLKRMRLPVELDDSLEAADIAEAMQRDKKTLGGRIRFALPEDVGRCSVFEEIEPGSIRKAIEEHKKWPRNLPANRPTNRPT